jgi:hypothetical protein
MKPLKRCECGRVVRYGPGRHWAAEALHLAIDEIAPPGVDDEGMYFAIQAVAMDDSLCWLLVNCTMEGDQYTWVKTFGDVAGNTHARRMDDDEISELGRWVGGPMVAQRPWLKK